MQNVLLSDGAAAVSDETFLEQAKLKAQRALENVVLGHDTVAASDEALLQQAKLKAQDALKNVFLGDDRPADSDRARCLKHASKSFAWTSSGIPWAAWRSACKTEVSSRRAHVTWCCGRLDLNPRKCIQVQSSPTPKSRIGPTTLVKQWNKSCSAGCSPHR